MPAGFDFLDCISTKMTCVLGHQNSRIVVSLIMRHTVTAAVAFLLGLTFCFALSAQEVSGL